MTGDDDDAMGMLDSDAHDEDNDVGEDVVDESCSEYTSSGGED